MRACAVAGAAVAFPFGPAAKALARHRAGKGYVVKAGQDRTAQPLALFAGDTFWTKVAPAGTAGDLCFFESSRVREGGPA